MAPTLLYYRPVNEWKGDLQQTRTRLLITHGTVNHHNTHMWCHTIPHTIRVSHRQQRFTLNMWLRAVGDRLLGPHIISRHFKGQTYLRFLQRELQDMLDDFDLQTRRRMWFMLDGAPVHFCPLVRRHVNSEFGRSWIGRRGPVAWPPRSHDFNPLEFCIWDHLKTILYDKPVIPRNSY